MSKSRVPESAAKGLEDEQVPMQEESMPIDEVCSLEIRRVLLQDQFGQEHRKRGIFDPWSRPWW